MPQSYTPEFKKKIVRLHIEEGRTYKSITAEYGVSKASISKWCSEFSKECQNQANSNEGIKTELDLMKENLRLRKELEEAKKENLFLKKAAAFFRWLLGRLGLCPNAYYNYLKLRKEGYLAHKAEVHAQIQEIYHSHNGVDGYRSMKVYLERKGYRYIVQ